MESLPIDESTKKDIQKQVGRILKDLGNPEPPLDLRLVRELLELDLQYYSSRNDGVLREKIYQIKMAGKQILKRSSLILDAVKKFELTALYLPDRQRILIDSSTPKLKLRWTEAHEITHSICEWHGDVMLGDDKSQLNPQCHAEIESEANYGAGRLLFLGERFETEANDSSPSIKNILTLKETFGNTISSTLWRVVESSHSHLPMVGMMSPHPIARLRRKELNPLKPARHFVRSSMFSKQFGNITDVKVFE